MEMHEKPEPVRSVETTGLAWGVRSSFRRYVQGGALGSETPDGRAGSLPDGRFYFPVGDVTSFDTAAVAGRISFIGGVRFVGHGGMIDLRIGELDLELAGGRGFVRTSSAGGPRNLVEVSVIDVATGEGQMAVRLESRLAPGAERMFNEVYTAGAPFEDLEIRIATA